MTKINLDDPNVQKDIKQNKFMAYFSYFGFLCLVPLFFKRKSNFVQFHAKQGFVLFLVAVIINLIGLISFDGFVFYIIFISRVIASFYVFFSSLFGVYSVYDGTYWQLPILGKFAQKLE